MTDKELKYLPIVKELIQEGILTGLDWAGEDYTECLLPYNIRDLKGWWG
jgi:hypothetical protein